VVTADDRVACGDRRGGDGVGGHRPTVVDALASAAVSRAW
jgi:hypothetical protein